MCFQIHFFRGRLSFSAHYTDLWQNCTNRCEFGGVRFGCDDVSLQGQSKIIEKKTACLRALKDFRHRNSTLHRLKQAGFGRVGLGRRDGSTVVSKLLVP